MVEQAVELLLNRKQAADPVPSAASLTLTRPNESGQGEQRFHATALPVTVVSGSAGVTSSPLPETVAVANASNKPQSAGEADRPKELQRREKKEKKVKKSHRRKEERHTQGHSLPEHNVPDSDMTLFWKSICPVSGRRWQKAFEEDAFHTPAHYLKMRDMVC